MKEAFVLVSRWRGVRVPGSRKVPCSRCGETCGVSPGTFKQVTDSGHTPLYVCASCITKEDIDAMKGNLIMPSPAVLKELHDAFQGPSLN